jgi:hypothetical protein
MMGGTEQLPKISTSHKKASAAQHRHIAQMKQHSQWPVLSNGSGAMVRTLMHVDPWEV